MSVSNNIIGAGSFNRDIALYDTISNEQIVLLKQAHKGGITQLNFVHNNYLISAGRKCSDLHVSTNQYDILSKICAFERCMKQNLNFATSWRHCNGQSIQIFDH